MWDKEKDFAKYIMTKLKNEGTDCTRIETGSTTNGMPDLWIQVSDDDYFIELKNIHHDLPAICDIEVASEIIPWRPGQQAWALRYKAHHKSKCSWTVVGMNDGVIFIRMEKHFENDLIKYRDPCIFFFKKSTLKTLNFSMFFQLHTYIQEVK